MEIEIAYLKIFIEGNFISYVMKDPLQLLEMDYHYNYSLAHIISF